MPTAFAADEQVMEWCNKSYPYKLDEIKTADTKDPPNAIDEYTKSIVVESQESLAKDKTEYSSLEQNHCGKDINTSTGYLEKGDCSMEGKIVTELVEFNASNVTLDDKNKVVTVYASTCCLVGYVDNYGDLICDDVRTVYSPTYDSCMLANIDTTTHTTTTSATTSCEKRTWIIGTSGMSLLKLTVKYLYVWAAGIVGTVALVTIIYNGIKISLSGVSGDVSAARDKILQAIMAIVLLFLSSLLLYTINPTFFG
jgi:hypothetical protein